ncbi:DUF4249 family protein [uncultured Mucilaginibacter sp.]|uniref:DUF4249 family protein n=1 Tax=uncultured Mucilaginibacter sp. TaxID=797541 RepID=UPI0025D23F70|nr:DUF4249 family protein [uncultured Mucilaginibacter sp.]
MKRKLLNRILLLCFAVIIISACKKESTGSSSVYLPVVEGYLMPGQALSIKLYQQKSLTDTAKYGAAISGMQVYVSDGSTKVQLSESPKGTYTYSDQGFLAEGKTYTLQFNYLTYAVSAKTVMPGKPTNFATQYGSVTLSSTTTTDPNTSNTTIDKLTWDNPDSLNHVLVFYNKNGADFPLSSFGGNRPANFELNTNRASYYNLTQATFPYYGHYTVTLLRVNQEFIDLIKSNTSNSTSQNLTNIPTNVVNGYGIFTAMQSDTLSFNLL